LTNHEAFTILGSAYFQRGDYEKALKNIDQAVLLDKNDSEAYRWRGEIYLATKDTKKSLSDFRQSYRIHVTFDAGIGIARAMLAQDSFRDAYEMIVTVEKLLKTDEQRGIFFYYRALSLEGLNEQVAASRAWNDLLKLPEKATTEDMRADAKAHVIALQSATPPLPTSAVKFTPTVTRTITITPTPKK
jgi:tetratricopeptide (TPR) repeat protein